MILKTRSCSRGRGIDWSVFVFYSEFLLSWLFLLCHARLIYCILVFCVHVGNLNTFFCLHYCLLIFFLSILISSLRKCSVVPLAERTDTPRRSRYYNNFIIFRINDWMSFCKIWHWKYWPQRITYQKNLFHTFKWRRRWEKPAKDRLTGPTPLELYSRTKPTCPYHKKTIPHSISTEPTSILLIHFIFLAFNYT